MIEFLVLFMVYHTSKPNKWACGTRSTCCVTKCCRFHRAVPQRAGAGCQVHLERLYWLVVFSKSRNPEWEEGHDEQSGFYAYHGHYQYRCVYVVINAQENLCL